MDQQQQQQKQQQDESSFTKFRFRRNRCVVVAKDTPQLPPPPPSSAVQLLPPQSIPQSSSSLYENHHSKHTTTTARRVQLAVQSKIRSAISNDNNINNHHHHQQQQQQLFVQTNNKQEEQQKQKHNRFQIIRKNQQQQQHKKNPPYNTQQTKTENEIMDQELFDMISTHNIDEALQSLYSSDTHNNNNNINNHNNNNWSSMTIQQQQQQQQQMQLLHHSTKEKKTELLSLSFSSPAGFMSSYVPQNEMNWILDGKDEWMKERYESKQLLNELYTSHEEFINQLHHMTNRLNSSSSSSSSSLPQNIINLDDPNNNYNDNNENENDNDNDNDDDDDFGDFQSANTLPTFILPQPTIVLIPPKIVLEKDNANTNTNLVVVVAAAAASSTSDFVCSTTHNHKIDCGTNNKNTDNNSHDSPTICNKVVNRNDNNIDDTDTELTTTIRRNSSPSSQQYVPCLLHDKQEIKHIDLNCYDINNNNNNNNNNHETNEDENVKRMEEETTEHTTTNTIENNNQISDTRNDVKGDTIEHLTKTIENVKIYNTSLSDDSSSSTSPHSEIAQQQQQGKEEQQQQPAPLANAATTPIMNNNSTNNKFCTFALDETFEEKKAEQEDHNDETTTFNVLHMKMENAREVTDTTNEREKANDSINGSDNDENDDTWLQRVDQILLQSNSNHENHGNHSRQSSSSTTLNTPELIQLMDHVLLTATVSVTAIPTIPAITEKNHDDEDEHFRKKGVFLSTPTIQTSRNLLGMTAISELTIPPMMNSTKHAKKIRTTPKNDDETTDKSGSFIPALDHDNDDDNDNDHIEMEDTVLRPQNLKDFFSLHPSCPDDDDEDDNDDNDNDNVASLSIENESKKKYPNKIVTSNASIVYEQEVDQQLEQFTSSSSSSLPVPLSLLLPLDDLSTLEARLVRRRQIDYEKSQKLLHETSSTSIQTTTTTTTAAAEDHHTAKGHQQQQQQQTVLEMSRKFNLPMYFFQNTKNDDTISFLRSLPWEYVLTDDTTTGTPNDKNPPNNAMTIIRPDDKTSDTSIEIENDPSKYYDSLWEEYCTERLCHLDEALDKVQTELFQYVIPNQSKIDTASQFIHEFDQNLRLAFMYWARSKEDLDSAAVGKSDNNDDDMNVVEGSGVVDGPTTLLKLWEQRDELQNLEATIKQVDKIWQQESELLHRIDSFDACHGNSLDEYYSVRRMAAELEKSICSDSGGGMEHSLSHLFCLEDVRSRLSSLDQRFWERLLRLSASVIVRCSRNIHFEWTEYDSLLKAVFDLQGSCQLQVLNINNASFDWIGSWTENVVSALLYECERSLAFALLEPYADCEIQERIDTSWNTELDQLRNLLTLDWGDYKKLRSSIHQLASMRFEISSSNDPIIQAAVSETKPIIFHKVYHKLCQSLSIVLDSYSLFIQWHETKLKEDGAQTLTNNNENDCDQHIHSIVSNLNANRKQIWDACLMVLAKALDDYLLYAANRVLFKTNESQGGTTLNDSEWIIDVQALHQVHELTDLFCSLKGSFLTPDLIGTSTTSETSSYSGVNEDYMLTLIYEKITELCRINLRSLHVTAMNAVGKKLANETWLLGNFLESNDEKSGELETIESIFFNAITTAAALNFEGTCNNMNANPSFLRKAPVTFPLKTNPFTAYYSYTDGNQSLLQLSEQTVSKTSLSDTSIKQTLSSLVSNSNWDRRMAPEVVTREMVLWFTRLLIVMQQLPLIFGETSLVFPDLCDLYVCTVLRICAGTAKNEKFLLGIDRPFFMPLSGSDDKSTLQSDFDKTSIAPLYIPFLTGKSKKNEIKKKLIRRNSTVHSPFIDAEVCSPLLRDLDSIEPLRVFIQHSQQNLQSVVHLDKVDAWMMPTGSEDKPQLERACEDSRLLEKRIGAAWSCYVVAALLEVVCSLAQFNCQNPHQLCVMNSDSNILKPLKDYYESLSSVTNVFVTIATRVSCSRVLSGTEIVNDIAKVGKAWEECKLNEYHNDYVENLCDRASLIWGFLSASSKLPFAILKTVWESIITVSYLSMLEGFSKILVCSTEGRSLMTLDLASFAAGVSSAGVLERLKEGDDRGTLLAVATEPDNGTGALARQMMQYVDMYVKVFYYPLDDALQWIAENKKNYRIDHALSLVIAISNSNSESEVISVDHLIEKVNQIYKNE